MRYIISEGEKFRERGELKFESANNTELSFSHKELRKNVKIAASHVVQSGFLDRG